jgi:rubrerythrin
MEAVQKYASYSQSTIESVKPVAKDFYASCTRTNSFKPLNSHSDCKTEQEASKAILTVSNVLDEYAVALGALAADELVSYDTDIDAMTTEIKGLKVKGLEENKVDAVGSLAKLISKAATSAYQQQQVGNFIRESDTSITTVTETLSSIIEKNYSTAIEMEISAWEDGYKRVERAARTEKPLEWEAYSKAQWKDRAELDAKLNAVKDLAKNIREIGSTHTKLKKDAEKLTGKEVAAFVRSFVEEAKPVIKEVQDAFLTK